MEGHKFLKKEQRRWEITALRHPSLGNLFWLISAKDFSFFLPRLQRRSSAERNQKQKIRNPCLYKNLKPVHHFLSFDSRFKWGEQEILSRSPAKKEVNFLHGFNFSFIVCRLKRTKLCFVHAIAKEQKRTTQNETLNNCCIFFRSSWSLNSKHGSWRGRQRRAGIWRLGSKINKL